MNRSELAGTLNIYAPPRAALLEHEPMADQAVFFPVGLTKLAIMTVFTAGLYLLYWFYRNWLGAPGGSGSRGKASLAALFYPVTAYFLLREVNECNVRCDGKERIAAAGLALALLLLGMSGTFPDPYGLVSLFAFVPLLPAQQVINRLNARHRPLAAVNTRLTGSNFAWMAAISVLTALGVFGMIGGAQA